jgi:hypothetical protein
MWRFLGVAVTREQGFIRHFGHLAESINALAEARSYLHGDAFGHTVASGGFRQDDSPGRCKSQGIGQFDDIGHGSRFVKRKSLKLRQKCPTGLQQV